MTSESCIFLAFVAAILALIQYICEYAFYIRRFGIVIVSRRRRPQYYWFLLTIWVVLADILAILGLLM